MGKQSYFIEGRTLVWFSCGAASAVAAKLAVNDMLNVEVCYCDTLAYEHPDNRRFLADVERWIGQSVKMLYNPAFADIFDVFRRERYIVGRDGAPCTKHLKRNVRMRYQDRWDSHVFGFTVDEQSRIDQFIRENPNLSCHWILSDRNITKRDCLQMVADAGIELPAMYRLGYHNNNCIGCVKGGAGYWNKIRRDFPEAFERMAKLEREIGYAICRHKSEPCYLDELPPDAGRYVEEPDIECGPQCVRPEMVLTAE